MRFYFSILFVLFLFPTTAFAQNNGTERQVPAKQIRTLAADALEEVLPRGVELNKVRWTQPIRLPRGEIDMVAYLEGDEPVRDRLRARLEIFVDDQSIRTIRIQITVRDRRRVVVATRQLRPGQTIGQNDIELRQMPPGVYVREPLRDPNQVIGNVITRMTEAGQVLEQRVVRPPAAVSRRERVQIVARAGGVEVIAAGEALEDGAIGEDIRVVCLASRRTLEVRVVRQGLVEVR